MTRDPSPVTTAQALDALRAEGQTGLPLEAQSRLAARLKSAIIVGDFLAAAASNARAAAAPTAAAMPVEPAASAVDRFAALLASHPVATLVTTLALGAFAGASVHSMLSNHVASKPETARSVVPAAPSAPARAAAFANDAPVASVDDLPLVAARESAMHVPDARRTKPSAVDPVGSALPTASASMAEQLALLERARAALGRGDNNAALQILGEHARAYPASALGEEREALAIKALSRGGQRAEAKARLAQFEARFPGSLMLPALKGAVGVVAGAPPATHSDIP